MDLCDDCAEDLRQQTRRPFRAEGGALALPLVAAVGDQLEVLPAMAAAQYDGLVSRAVLGFKDHELIHLDRILGPALHRAVHALRRSLGAESGASAVLLVAPPASPAARVRRSHHPVEHLLRSTGLRPASGLMTVTAQSWLRAMLPGASHQKGHGMTSRRRRLAGTLRVTKAGEAMLAGAEVIMVDDVLTTGSTLHEMYVALSGAGARVLGAAVVAAAPKDGKDLGTRLGRGF